MCVRKITTATMADSVMPRMVRTMNAASKAIVAGMMGRPDQRECTACIATVAEMTAVAM